MANIIRIDRSSRIPSCQQSRLITNSLIVGIAALFTSFLGQPILHAQSDGSEVLYSFTGGNDGGFPYSSLISDNAGNFYGTATYGGSHKEGVVFSITASGKETVLYNFIGAAARAPNTTLSRSCL